MGLAASQARLLLLTARKNDLEYRAQQITNAEMILAMQTEEVAREYSIKISNQTIMFTDAQDKDQTTKPITAAGLSDLGSGDVYSLRMNPGNNYTLADDQGNLYDVNSNEYKNLSSSEKAALHKITPNDWPKWTPTYDENGKMTNNYTGPEILQGYNNGSMKIVDAKGEEVDLNSNNGFVTTYYTDDDRAAEAEYNTKTAAIQVKEKRLQNDLNQVQTQQKACDTEIDSVKKIMDKNIERTFKVFS